MALWQVAELTGAWVVVRLGFLKMNFYSMKGTQLTDLNDVVLFQRHCQSGPILPRTDQNEIMMILISSYFTNLACL